ncbi:class F sortase [Frigoribacterium faeni]|uniref:class F sortase n=1 Tax=Frigoribacterium faeni TaxID=145483 RepID=UPI001FAB617E|nr:class F sortase [Frigoribacterium faeni]MCJ0702195.1 class F sortase [Frigoribacterium faeni]
MVALVLTGCAPGSGGAPATPTEITAPTGSGPTAEPSAPPAGSSAPSAAPTPAASPAIADGVAPIRVSVPSIELDEPLIDLGIAADGRMEVPTDFDDVGWFTGGGRPGGRGPTVIAAHVDSTTGPAVFARLSEVVVGDEVEVLDADGTPARYAVTEVEDFAKADFPTARVFGATADDSLRLITCGGFFDRSVGHYDDNRVVFAERVS